MATLLARDAELAALQSALADARRGRGRLFLLVGEAGIGKTRLADELCARAGDDLRTLWGRCSEAGGAPAFWPWIEVLRPLIAGADREVVGEELGGAARYLGALIPQVAYAELLLSSGERADADRAGALLDDARATAVGLDMPGLLTRIDDRLGSRARAGRSASPSSSSLALTDLREAFSLDGEYWTVTFDGRPYRFQDSKGLQILVHLLGQPGREVHVLELSALASGTPSGESLLQGSATASADPKARVAYRARIEDLRDRLQEAEANQDLGRATRLREEIELLEEEIGRAVGLGGRERQSGGSAERARINVQRRIADALRKIEEACPPLGRKLAGAVRTGTTCLYDPR